MQNAISQPLGTGGIAPYIAVTKHIRLAFYAPFALEALGASFLRSLKARYMLLNRWPVTPFEVSSTGHKAAKKSL